MATTIRPWMISLESSRGPSRWGRTVTKAAPARLPHREPMPPMTTMMTKSIEAKMPKVSGVTVTQVVGKEASADGGKDRRDREDGDLSAVDVHAHRRRGDLVRSQRREAPPDAAPHQVQREREGDHGRPPEQVELLRLALERNTQDPERRDAGQPAGPAGDPIPLDEDVVHHDVEPERGHD